MTSRCHKQSSTSSLTTASCLGIYTYRTRREGSRFRGSPINPDNKQRQDYKSETISPHHGNGCVHKECKVIPDLRGDLFKNNIPKPKSSWFSRGENPTGASSKMTPLQWVLGSRSMAMLLMGASQRHEQAVTMVPCVKILVRVTSGHKNRSPRKGEPSGHLRLRVACKLIGQDLVLAPRDQNH